MAMKAAMAAGENRMIYNTQQMLEEDGGGGSAPQRLRPYLSQVEEEAGVLARLRQVGQEDGDADEQHGGVFAHAAERLQHAAVRGDTFPAAGRGWGWGRGRGRRSKDKRHRLETDSVKTPLF